MRTFSKKWKGATVSIESINAVSGGITGPNAYCCGVCCASPWCGF